MSWAASLVGRPYEPGADGPESFDCVGLVRYYFRHRHGLELPDYHLLDAEGLQQFVRATRWRRAEGPPRVDDVLTMTNPSGRHVGVMVQTSEGPALLHAVGTRGVGQVVCQPLNTLFGYREIEIWRQREH